MSDATEDDAIRQQPAFAELDDTTLAVRRLVSASQHLMVRTARRMAMNVSDMTAIMALIERGPMGIAEIARRLGVSSAAATVLVDRLHSAGYLNRVRDTVDRRRVTVTETPAARAATQHAWLPVIQEIDHVCRSLPPPERAVARELLDRLSAVMNRSS